MDTRLFYEDYENDENVANMVDQACLSCPVMKQCLKWGIENSEHGVWGALYLVSGRPDETRNAHKPQEVWERIRENVESAL